MITFDPGAVRDAFETATDAFGVTLRRVPEDAWSRPSGCGTWTVRELVAHTMRSWSLIGAYLDAPPDDTEAVVVDVSDYYAAAFAVADVHDDITRRAVADAAVLTDPVGEFDVLTPLALARVAGTGDDDPVNTRFGQMPFVQYLATRVVEVGLHHVDLQRAIGEPPDIHPSVAAVCLQVLTTLGHATTIVLALSGRGELPAGFSVLS